MRLRSGLRIMSALGWIALGGCATAQSVKPVAVGDRVGVNFTCRLSSGEIAITTDRAVTQDPSLPKSALFVPRELDGPLEITAAASATEGPSDLYAAFEDRVVQRLSCAVVGMAPGETRTLAVTAEREDLGLKLEDVYLKMSRVRHRPKEFSVDEGAFAGRMRQALVVGEDVDLEEGLTARVISVEDGKVLLSLAALAGRELRTPFGPATLREGADDMEITIDPQVGKLVRSGPLAGRISSADDASFTLDYGHPFGGEELTCEIALETVAEPGAQTAAR
jgi:FKBP-type peptidyl-prolyl cis-trans isomerase 2